MRLVALAMLALLTATAGCAEMGEGMSRLTGGRAPDVPLPYYVEYRADVVPQHDRSYALPVDADATRLTARLVLETRDAGTGLGAFAPARLQLTLHDATGATVATAWADPARPEATLTLDAPAPGDYTARIAGAGISESLDDVRYGAAYLLTVEVAYG